MTHRRMAACLGFVSHTMRAQCDVFNELNDILTCVAVPVPGCVCV